MSRPAAARGGLAAGAAILLFYLLLPHLLIPLLPRGAVTSSLVCILQPLGALALAFALGGARRLLSILKIPLPDWGLFRWLMLLAGLMITLGITAAVCERMLNALQIPFSRPDSECLVAEAPALLYACFAFSAIFLAPLTEEVLFRYLFFCGIRTLCTPVTAAILSAGLFAALHFTVLQFLPLMVMGLLLQWLFLRTRSLRAALLLHALNNLVSFVLLSLSFRW